jgi:hypothetical protein
MTLLNATGKSQTFDIIDQKESRKGFTLAPGEHQSFPTKNPFDGYQGGFVTIRFADGQRVESEMSDGGAGIMYLDSRSPGKVVIDKSWLRDASEWRRGEIGSISLERR